MTRLTVLLLAGKFWWYTLYIFLTLMYYTYAGLVAIVIAPSLQVSSVACTIFYALWNLFSGVLITLPQVPVRLCCAVLLRCKGTC